MNTKPRRIWAELRRGDVVLLVPELGWLSVTLAPGIKPEDQPTWDQASGVLLVSDRAAATYRLQAAEEHSSSFQSTLAHFEGPLISGTTGAAALTPEAARELQVELMAFLEGGAFSWRFVSF